MKRLIVALRLGCALGVAYPLESARAERPAPPAVDLILMLATDVSEDGGYSSLERYHRAVVAGGVGSFLKLITSMSDLKTAFRDKLVREICGDTLSMLR